MESVLVSFLHSDAVMPHQAGLMHALAQVCQVRQHTTYVLAPFLILVAALLESSMPANPSSYFGDISARGSAVMIFIDELFSKSCQNHIEFPLKFDQRLADFQSVLVGFPMDS